MSDLAKDLLTQYYGFGAASSGKKFLSIHRNIERVKNEDEKQITEQHSLTNNDENVANEELQKDIEEDRKLSIGNNLYPQSSQVLDNLEDTYDNNENFDIRDIDFGPNILCSTFENVSPKQSYEQLSDISDVHLPKQSTNDVSSNYVKINIEDPEIEINDGVRDAKKDELNLELIEDTFSDDISEYSSLSYKESKTFLKSNTSLLSNESISSPLVAKKEPIYNDMFADFSNTDLKQFPIAILNNFSQLRMLYLSNNNLIEVPDEIFTYLNYLQWLDIRNNQITFLPVSIKWHSCLETILLQGNKIKELPLELCTLSNLKNLQVADNPLIMPPQDIVTSGCATILEFLRIEWNKQHPDEWIEPKKNKIEPKLSTILCYQSPRKNKKKITSLKDMCNKNIAISEKRKLYKPSSRCENKGANIIMEHRLLWFSKLRDLIAKQTATIQKIKDENFLKEWRQDKRSYTKAMQKAMKRNEDDIPFDIDVEDYASIFKQNSKLKKLKSKKKDKQRFSSPIDINKKINELLESLNKLEINTTYEISPRSKQNLYKNEIEKILQFQNEIQNLRKYNEVNIPYKVSS